MRDARVRDVVFADGEYDFRLGWGQLVELQESSNAGPHFILNRLHSGAWLMEDIAHTIRLGLLGADPEMKPSKATTLVRRYVMERPPLENHTLAVVILTAALMGSPEEPVGEPEAANQTVQSTTSQMDESDLPPSMEPVPSSGTRRRKSTK
jgi:hypothetical protein